MPAEVPTMCGSTEFTAARCPRKGTSPPMLTGEKQLTNMNAIQFHQKEKLLFKDCDSHWYWTNLRALDSGREDVKLDDERMLADLGDILRDLLEGSAE